MSLHLLALCKYAFFPQGVTLRVLLFTLNRVEPFTSQGVYEEQLLRPDLLMAVFNTE